MVTRHPSANLRMAYMAGDISPGTGLAVNVHMEHCPLCRADVGYTSAERQGRGTAGARAATTLEPDKRTAAALSRFRALRGLRRSPWRWVAPGVRAAKLHEVAGLAETVCLLKLAPRAHLPAAAWRACAQLAVLDGSLTHRGERLVAGDFLEPLQDRVSGPAVADAEGCLCLMVTDSAAPASLPERIARRLRSGLF